MSALQQALVAMSRSLPASVTASALAVIRTAPSAPMSSFRVSARSTKVSWSASALATASNFIAALPLIRLDLDHPVVAPAAGQVDDVDIAVVVCDDVDVVALERSATARAVQAPDE